MKLLPLGNGSSPMFRQLCINKTIFDGQYTGKTYNVNGETYAICSENLSGCKSYTSYGRAQNAYNKLNERICNYVSTIEEIYLYFLLYYIII